MITRLFVNDTNVVIIFTAIGYFIFQIEEVEVKRENVDHLKDLLKLVETLHSKNGIK